MGSDGDQHAKSPQVEEELVNRLDQMNVNQEDYHMSIDLDERAYEENISFDSDGSKQTTEKSQSSENGSILIVTNIDLRVFSDQTIRSQFEQLFTKYDSNINFRYLKSFKRVRLDFSSRVAAQAARQNLNNYQLGDTAFRCFSAKIIKLSPDNGSNNQESKDDNEDDSQQGMFLRLPKLTKQFLISPPASPPVGWEPVTESSPCIDVQFISALANLVPGQVHEIHSGSDSQPGIFVEVCEEAQFEVPKISKTIPKTPNPCFQMQH